MSKHSLLEIFERLEDKHDLAHRSYEKGDKVYARGEPAQSLCYPEQGAVFLYTTANNHRNIVSFQKEEELFGLEGTVDTSKGRKYSAEAFSDDTEIIYVPYRDVKSDFTSLLLEETNRVRDEREDWLRERIEIKRDVGAKGVVCYELLNLSDKFGPEFELKIAEMADLIGTSNKTVNRYLLELEEEGLMEREGQSSQIRLARDGLEEELDRF